MSATRPWVEAFAGEMEAKLAANRHKGDREGWRQLDPLELLAMLKREVEELEGAMWGQRDEGGLHSEVVSECADVANFAMMIADVAGQMRPRPGASDLGDSLSLWFGLSYANYLTAPRALLEAMPDEWQGRLASLLQDLDQTFTWPLGEDLRIEVRLRDRRGRLVSDPLAEYRHPDADAIEASRRLPPAGDRRAHPRLDFSAPLTPGDIPGRNG